MNHKVAHFNQKSCTVRTKVTYVNSKVALVVEEMPEEERGNRSGAFRGDERFSLLANNYRHSSVSVVVFLRGAEYSTFFELILLSKATYM